MLDTNRFIKHMSHNACGFALSCICDFIPELLKFVKLWNIADTRLTAQSTLSRWGILAAKNNKDVCCVNCYLSSILSILGKFYWRSCIHPPCLIKIFATFDRWFGSRDTPKRRQDHFNYTMMSSGYGTRLKPLSMIRWNV